MWEAASGASITPEDVLTKQLTDSARRWARQHMGNRDRDNAIAGIRFLGHHRFDREIIERQLAAVDFYGGLSSSYDGKDVQSVELHGESRTRRAADDALAAWDGKPAPDRERSIVPMYSSAPCAV